MSRLHPISFVHENITLEVPDGITVMEALKTAGIFLDAPCGGQGSCKKCLVHVRRPDGEWEQVLACQTVILSDMEVDTGENAGKYHILTSSLDRKVRFQPLPFAAMPDRESYMAAVDIGTTTIVAYLLDRRTGREVCNASCLNPQAAYGADVISRADYVLNHGPEELADCIHGAVDQLMGVLAQKAAIERSSIVQICLVGNTCMHHIFFGLPMGSLVRAPYVPYQKGLIREKAAQYHIRIHPEGELLFLPVIAGFVGADTMGCILAIRPDQKDEITLMIDIGTNGELVLGNRDRLVCCSTAAGPAFEGAKIECGMRGTDGAIDHVSYKDGIFSYSVIADIPPIGICGSGLIDAIACLLQIGLIDESGKFLEPDAAKASFAESISCHLTRRGNMAVFLFDPQNPDVYLSQKDIREVQLAKGAIAAGILLLEKHLGITHKEIQRIYIAGAFGNYMNPDSSCMIGLLPSSLRECVVPVGNAAGEGAKIALQNSDELQETIRLSEHVEFVELAAIPEFQDCFIDELEFPVPAQSE